MKVQNMLNHSVQDIFLGSKPRKKSEVVVTIKVKMVVPEGGREGMVGKGSSGCWPSLTSPPAWR